MTELDRENLNFYFPGKLKHSLRNGFGEEFAYQSHVQMSFAELQVSQVIFEQNLVGTDGTLEDFDTPEYLLERGIIGEAKEALEALKEHGPDSDAFRDELIDIVVFISALFNHVGIKDEKLENLLAQATMLDEQTSIACLLKEKIVCASRSALEQLMSAGSNSEVFQEAAIKILLLTVKICKSLDMSDPELRNRTSRKVSVNFGKYRPQAMVGKPVKEGLAISRANFTRG